MHVLDFLAILVLYVGQISDTQNNLQVLGYW